MQCLSPLVLQSTKPGQRTNVVPCGKCAACVSRKRNEWTIRLQKEFRYAIDGYFITLTYSDENLDFGLAGYPTVNKRDIQLFLKRLRKRLPKSKIRYFISSEYGPNTCRPHYHGILMNCGGDPTEAIEKSWNMGFVTVSSVTDARIHYVTKYCITRSKVPPGSELPFSLMSRRPGIGSKWLDRTRQNRKERTFYITSNAGIRATLPRYFRDRLFSDQERRAHALEMEIRSMDELSPEKCELYEKKYHKTLLQALHEKKVEFERIVQKQIEKSQL